LGELEREAAETGRLWALATAARCRGMLAEDGDVTAFAEALALAETLGSPFERARTELRFGEWLRRLRRPADAREPLRSALATFEALGAEPWARRAQGELTATGDRARRRAPTAPGGLTPQEARIASLVADGATNREIAAALFLSPKTVGYHLGKTYEKLGLNSRAQLAALVSRDGSAQPEPLDEPATL
jgi:DNA-binding CsgD family transcriptional regulator